MTTATAVKKETATALSYSETLGHYCAGLKLAAVPTDVKEKAKLCVLDAIGCMIAATSSHLGKVLTTHALDWGKPGASTIFGCRTGVNVESAVLANAAMCHVLELDDGHRPSGNHLGCVIIPSALGAAEHSGATGADLLRAVIAGYDVMGRAGAAVCLPRTGQRFHGTATTGGFGGAAAAGTAWGLSASELAHAFGITGSGAGGSHEVLVSGIECKPFQVGRAAAGGVKAAALAKGGLEGPRHVFEGKYGYVASMTVEPRPELVISELGTRYAVMDSGFKVHATCGRMFTPIDAVLALKKKHSLKPEQVEKIRVGLPGWIRGDTVFKRPRPATIGAARFSFPFGVSSALLYDEVTPRQISEEGIRDPAIAALETKVEIEFDPKMEELYNRTKDDAFFFHPAVVTITAGGKDYHHLAEAPRGYDLRTGLTVEEIVSKFLANVSGQIEAKTAQRAVDLILSLESLASVKELELLRPR